MTASRKLQLGLIAAGGVTLIALATERMTSLAMAAEQIAFEHAIAVVRANLTAATARALVDGDTRGLASLDHGNPFTLLPAPPGDYAGTRSHDAGVPPGSWYFDGQRQELVYLPRFAEGFADGRGRARIRVVYHDRDGDGRYAPDRDRLRSVGLEVIAGTRRR